MHGGKILDRIELELRSQSNSKLRVMFDVFDNTLSRKWLREFNHLLVNDFHLEKNYCFLGFADGDRHGQLILDQVNRSIQAINDADLGYHINDRFDLDNSIIPWNYKVESHDGVTRPPWVPGEVDSQHLNQLHRYFEDLQGISGAMSPYYDKADDVIRWHIRQLNLLCHEFESWALSNRKKHVAPEWQRPSQLMCWLNAPRFQLEKDDFDLFGIETMNRPLGGVFVGVNKAIGKHHWEVFVDEARYNPAMIIDDLQTTTMRGQLEASGDFDIEWANNPGEFEWQKKHLADFRLWLINNGFDPDNKTLTIGHPQIGQVLIESSFGTADYRRIWHILQQHLDVYSCRSSDASACYDYRWSDEGFVDLQVDRIRKGN